MAQTLVLMSLIISTLTFTYVLLVVTQNRYIYEVLESSCEVS